MTQGEKLLGLGVIGVIAFWLYSKSRALASLVFTPGTIRGMQMTGGGIVVDLTIIAQNTSSATLQVDSFAGNVTCDGSIIGNISDFIPVFIPANSQSLVPVTISMNPLDLVNEILRAWNTSSTQKTINISGYANVSGAQLPVALSFKIG